jgi:hypothetical protein
VEPRAHASVVRGVTAAGPCGPRRRHVLQGRIHRLERLVRDVLRASGARSLVLSWRVARSRSLLREAGLSRVQCTGEAKDRAMQRYTQTAALAAAPEHGAVQFYTKVALLRRTLYVPVCACVRVCVAQGDRLSWCSAACAA